MYSLNGDVDFILPAVPLLKALNVTPGKSSLDHNIVTSADDLQDVVLHSMVTCSGVERTVTDKDLFDRIVQLSVNIPHEVSTQLINGPSTHWFNILFIFFLKCRNTLEEMRLLWLKRWYNWLRMTHRLWGCKVSSSSHLFSTWWCPTRRSC